MNFKHWSIICIVVFFINYNISKSQQSLIPTASFLGPHEYERVGYHLHAAGDVNGDGYDDFLIGAFHNKTNGYDAGAAYLILGSQSANWGHDLSLLNADARFLGAQPYEAVGLFLGGGGDVNGDGLDDFLIGAAGTGGYLYIVFGRASANWGMDFVLYDQADAWFEQEKDGDQAGLSNAIIGDINGDGYDDIICGAPFNDYGGNDAGKAYIILGKASGWKRGVNLSNTSASFYGVYPNGAFGYCVDGVGDVNGDKVPDFAISARNQGNVFLFFGRRKADWGENYEANNADVIFTAEQSGNWTGWRVSGVGDVNGDGFDDLVISTPYHNEQVNENGKVYLILGRRSGWKTKLSEADASYFGERSNDEAGWDTQGAGDVNGDGYDDFLIGALYNDSNGEDSGKMYLIKGKSSGWQRNVPLSEIQDYFVGEHAGDYAGFSVSKAGDVNGDGLSDIITSAPFYSEAYLWGGKIYLFVSHDRELPMITDSHASIMGENILLEWNPSLVTTIYNVYRDTSYNFVPDTVNGTNRIGFHVSDEDPNKSGIQWTDTGNGADIVGDVTKNYFYKVTAVAAVESPPSNVVGEFDYNLTTTNGTDINEIVVIMDTKNTSIPITTAEELAQAIPNCSDVYYWDAAGQGSVGHVKGLPFNNFSITPGYPYMVNVTAPTVWSTAGAYVTPSFNLITTAGTDINHLTVPLEKPSLTTVELLGQDIPGCTDVYYWDAAGQGTVGHVVGLPFNNFAVRVGYPYYVNVTTPTVWPAGSGSLLKSAGSSPNKNSRTNGGVPHTVYGKLSYAEKIDVKVNQVQIKAWIMGRPEAVLTREQIGVGCDENYWWVGVSNFVTDWAVGENLYVEVTAVDQGLRGTTVVLLSDAGSDNGGMIQLAKKETESELPLKELPEEFVLLPNYPNPFNPETIISYGLPSTGNVRIQIFDLSGRWIRTVVDGNMGPGYHQVTWNGKDNQGLPVSSGVYLCCMAAAEYRATMKLVLIK